ncbi:MAG: GSCFA family protein [Desulfuromonas sp.]|uniref:GSCFA domain-containing protein n=1 Tax=Desulfuromonas sp. TaxID=892 RepID=UPI000CC6ADF6|nr:GSCFA domain-containing protein [Desulfuromonas sp.]PLX82834.1 MAG: GSCFA family protein [Desulfuromonas sp.]
MKNPYDNLPERFIWKSSVANKSMFDISELWDPKFHIKQNQHIVTFGSCFAQHIGNAMKQRGFKWLSTENPPYGLSETNCKAFNYNIFSARTGNIYTTTLLKQWTEWALGIKDVPDEIWEKEGRFFDPFRPRIEPNGFASQEEVGSSLDQTISSFREAIKKSHYFVFTLGLTESWVNSDLGYEYPMCPGTAAGKFDDIRHKFVNQQFNQVISALGKSMEMMREVNSDLKFILTVSPVPLMATNSNQHVLVATMASKSILRAVTSQLVANRGYVDYFPAYEIINSPVFKGAFFEPNQRSVNPYGVSFVMDNFFKCLVDKFGDLHKKTKQTPPIVKKSDEVCEEELLEAFCK